MGGFEQKNTPRQGGARISLVLSGTPSTFASSLKQVCSDHEDISGVIYSIARDRIEVVAEGPEDVLKAMAKRVRASAGDYDIREAWQLPIASYEPGFMVVDLSEPSATARILMTGDVADMDYVSRHLQTEAVFNRGLKLAKNPTEPGSIDVVCSGKSERLKSFVRWCQNGPPLCRPDVVKVQWD